MKKTVLVLISIDDTKKKYLEQNTPGFNFEFESYDKLSPVQVQNANVIIGNPPAEMLPQAKKLEWLHLESAGTGSYVYPGILPEGVILTNSTGAYGLAISEHMLAMLLEIYKKLYLYRDHQKYGTWVDEGVVKSVYNSTALIVGMGDIGGGFAEKMHALGSYTIGVRRAASHKPDYLDELYHLDELDALLPRADVVALCLPETKETYHLFNRQKLLLMKQDAVLLNVGRGTAIQTEDLCDIMEAGYLLGAGLDVIDPEPLPSDHRLWKIPNVILTPHVSGGDHLPETSNRIFQIATQNLSAFSNNKPLRNTIDFKTGYRKI